jgi:hypothetical protein
VIDRLPAVLRANNVRVAGMRPIAPTLEDVFIELVENADATNGS